MNDHDLRLDMRSDPKLLASGRAMVRTYLERMQFQADKIQEVVLAVDEAFTNAMRHSYDGAEDETITLTVHSDEDTVYIDISDTGKTAPTEKMKQKQNETDKNKITPGGLGVQIMYQACDEVEFNPREPSGNCVSLRIKRPQSGQKAG